MASMKESENESQNVDNTARNNDKNMNTVQMMIWIWGHASIVLNTLHPPRTHHTAKTQDPRKKRREKKRKRNKSRKITRKEFTDRDPLSLSASRPLHALVYAQRSRNSRPEDYTFSR